ncbi:PREDICTED: U3 small nucleolar RNA-associated protein 14 isoform X1 [Camelina sativa]|uniref:U3 small nucleolar RNA-associated protein 14 isoform X1 n=1 Tax=Camelina sativa TaxID=90675 RepID=A0ABM0T8S0_CAMSA|nr:PREDICTED: U3 small nucleolar RNA-associated protein 14 isoform X1 [Camelina sativa]
MVGEKRRSTSKNLAKNKKRKGPHLPNSILKTIANEKRPLNSDEEDDEIDSDDANVDLYEYEEGVPEEESRKNNRYDPVVNYDYELPEDFEDENVESDDDDEGGNSDNEEGEGDVVRHTRMLQAVTGMPSAAFDGESKRKPVLFTEAYPESEFNPTRDVLEGKGLLTIDDFMAPIEGKPGFNDLQKRISRMQKDTQAVVHAPLPKPERERLERKAVKGLVDKEFNKWVHMVKRNREAPTVYFNQNVSLGYSTVGAIASEFQPRTDFEKKMASVLNDNELGEAHDEDGAKLLELNEVSVEDHIKYRDHIAKMRSLLFRHELKSKRIKKIKSKTYHRLKGKDLKKSAMGALMDPEMAKEEAMKQEARRVEERMTLKHKNTGKWAKRMISRGLNVKYDGTRAAISEQLQINATLSRKMNSTNDGSSSDESDDEEELNDGSDQDTPSKLIAKAREKTLKTVEDDEVPNSGLLSLPFMARAMKKKNEEAIEEAKRALEEYEEWENSGGEENSKKTADVSGRRVFGATAKVEAPKESRKDSDNFYDNSDSDNDMEGIENNDLRAVRDTASPVRNTGAITETEKFDDDIENPASKTTFDVALFASGSWKKMKGCQNAETKKKTKKHVPYSKSQDKKESRDEESEDSESEAEQMVDGILTSASKETYEIPSQAELIQRAFAGDDVVDEFEKEKQEVLNQEVPEPEKPVLVPGWGQWTNIQKKRGLPSWMVREHEDAKKKRTLDLKTRKDARLRHVIISEKVDKKAEKLHTTTLPFPYTSKEVFEHSMRMPIGPEFNPATIVGSLNRPEVVKKAGVIIKPLKFEEANPNEKVDDEHPRSNQKQNPKKGGKTGKGQRKGKSKQKTKA